MKRLLIVLLIVLTAAPVFAQTPVPPPPGPIDLPTLYSHLLYIEGRLDTIDAGQHRIELKVADVRELIVVQAEKPNPIVDLLTNEKFWTFISATVAAIAVIWQQKSN